MPKPAAKPLPKMSLYTRAIYTKLYELWSMTRYFVRTSVLAGHVMKNDRLIREVLVWLEKAGYVKRRGQRGGWMPVVKLDALQPVVKPVWTPVERPALAAA